MRFCRRRRRVLAVVCMYCCFIWGRAVLACGTSGASLGTTCCRGASRSWETTAASIGRPGPLRPSSPPHFLPSLSRMSRAIPEWSLASRPQGWDCSTPEPPICCERSTPNSRVGARRASSSGQLWQPRWERNCSGSRNSTPALQSLHAGGLSPACLYRVFEHIEANLDDELTVADLAHIARLSKSHFAAAFRKSTGMPPYRFAVHRKTQRAKEMLSDMERPIADIAYALGYSSQAHFTTMFRRMTGQSPGAYRTRLAEQAIPVSEVSRKDRRPV